MTDLVDLPVLLDKAEPPIEVLRGIIEGVDAT